VHCVLSEEVDCEDLINFNRDENEDGLGDEVQVNPQSSLAKK
jgi:hypothetical protein